MLCFPFCEIFAQWVSLGQHPKVLQMTSNGKGVYATSYSVTNPSPSTIRQVYITDDDWGTATQVANLPGSMYCCEYSAIDFVNDSVGFANKIYGGGTYVERTTTRGSTWQNFTIITSVYQCNGIKFLNSSLGFVYGNYSGQCTVYKVKPSSCTPVFQSDTLQLNGSYNSEPDVRFFDEDSGYVIAHATPLKSYVFKTVNGGSNWDTVFTVSGQQIKMAFPSPQIGYLVTSQGLIYKTTDFAHNWVSQGSPTSDCITAVAFKDDINGFITTNTGWIFHTVDGGLNWTQEVSPIGANLDNIYFADTTVYATTTNGSLTKRDVSLNVSIKEKNNSSNDLLSVFPNPATKELNIEIKENQKIFGTIYNANGKQVKLFNTTKIDISDLLDGMYQVVIIDSKGVVKHASFVKQ